MKQPPKNASIKEKILYADYRCQYWISYQNQLIEDGRTGKYANDLFELCAYRSQFWLDRLNELELSEE